MNLTNRVQLIGRLGANPVVRDFGGNKKLARFSIATTDVFKKDNEYIKNTEWHYIVAWGKLADIAESKLKKGYELVIDGRLVTRSYVDNKGIKRYITEIVAESLIYNSSEVFAA